MVGELYEDHGRGGMVGELCEDRVWVRWWANSVRIVGGGDGGRNV